MRGGTRRTHILLVDGVFQDLGQYVVLQPGVELFEHSAGGVLRDVSFGQIVLTTEVSSGAN